MLSRTSLLLVLAVAACVDRGPGPKAKKIDPGYVKENLLREVPAGIDRLDVDLGGKVVYLGSKLVYLDGKNPATPLAPGGAVRVVSYWQVKQPPGRGWQIFRLIKGAQMSADYMALPQSDMEIGHPVRTWKAGEIIQDAPDIVLRPDWRSPTATLQIGLIADGGHQLGDRMQATGQPGTVADRAIIAQTITVDLTKAPPPLGTIHVPHAAGPITIDGIGTEPGWANAVASTDFVTADGSPDPVGKTMARMTWDEQNLYLFVQVTDTDVFSSYKTHDDPIWKQDCVEMFIDADGNRRGYVELQVNPNNTTFDSFFATTRAQPGDEKWDAGMVTAVKVRGTADKGGDADQGWDVEIAIPLAAVKGRDEGMHVRLPPQVGDRWRLNVVRVDYRSNGGSPSVASWNRIGYGDFHALDRMLNVVFADATGAITPGASTQGAQGSGAGSAAVPATGSAAGSGSATGSASAPGPRSRSAAGSAASGSAAPAPIVAPGKAIAPGAGSGSIEKRPQPQAQPQAQPQPRPQAQPQAQPQPQPQAQPQP